MPEIARFLGIVVYLYIERGARHHAPHFHVRTGDHRATFAIAPPVLLAGSLPRRQERLVLAWAELHQTELIDNWRRVQNEKPPQRIEGL